MVDSEHVRVVVRRLRHLVDAAVVVPLDVRDIRAVENVGDEVNNVILHLRETKVQNKLVASERSFMGAGVQHPVRVFFVEAGVGVDHF